MIIGVDLSFVPEWVWFSDSAGRILKVHGPDSLCLS